MNIIFWYIRDDKLQEIGNFILFFSNFIALITKVNLFIDVDSIDKNILNQNVNLILNQNSELTNNANNKKINVLFFNRIIKELENDNILIIFLNLERINENYFFEILKEIKQTKYNKFLFLPFKNKNINKITETVALNFVYENISKKNILETINIDDDLSNKKLEKILKKIREI